MAFPSTLRRLVIALNGYEGPEYYQAGEAGLKPGMVVQEDDADEVKLCDSTTANPIGVVGCDADHDLSTAYSAGDRVPIYPLGCGVDLYVLSGDNTTITVTKGIILETGDLTTYTGCVKTIPDYAAVTTNTGDSTGRAYTARFWVGRALEAGSITSAVQRYIPCKLSI